MRRHPALPFRVCGRMCSLSAGQLVILFEDLSGEVE